MNRLTETLHPCQQPPYPSPFRVEVRQGIPGAEEEMERLCRLDREGVSASAAPLLLRAVEHPDERVPLLLLEHRLLPRGEREDLLLLLYRRAVEEALREGVLWTPLLDALSERGQWPTLKHAGSGLPSQYGRAQAVGDHWPFELLDPTKPWIAVQREEEALLKLQGFRSTPFGAALADSIPLLTPRLLEACFPGPEHWRALVLNPALQPEMAWQMGERGEGWLQELEGGKAKDFLWFLQFASERGFRFSASTVQAVQGWLAGVGESPEWRAEHQERIQTSESRATEFLLRSGALSAPALEELYQIIRERRLGTQHLSRLLRSPQAGEELLVRALQDFRKSSEVVRAVLARPEGRAHPEVRRALANSRSEEVQRELLRSAPPGEMRDAFRRAVRQTPRAAAQALQQWGAEALARLRQSDLLPLLASEEVEVRLAAIRASGSGVAADPPPSPRAGRKGR